MSKTKADLATTLTTCPKCHGGSIVLRSTEEDTCEAECAQCGYTYKVFFDADGMIEDVCPTGLYCFTDIEPCDEFGAKVVETRADD